MRTMTTSPLELFVQAKNDIGKMVSEVEEYVVDCMSFLIELPKEKGIVTETQVKALNQYKIQIHGIREVLARDNMKVAFFGRTSNGKSTVINAMLHANILPSGIGHTTNCFCQVVGTDSEEAFLLTEESKEKHSVESVSQLAHALCHERLSEKALVEIHWPKKKCPLLRHEVVLVDSPGIDVSTNTDEWIDRHCLDADVFVLVNNSESILMVTEKNFFHKVSSKLSRPNIFILNNRWDAAALDPRSAEVHQQHMEHNRKFLVEELGICNREEADNRIFFVSAKEALYARLQEQGGLPPHTGAIELEGFANRYFEFQDFEKAFAECLSTSAVKTKFEQHVVRGKSIITDIASEMGKIQERAHHEKSKLMMQRQELVSKLDYVSHQLKLITSDEKDQICHTVEDVERKVSMALNEEIRRLHQLVEEFTADFLPNHIVITAYKRNLNAHLDKGLGSNMRARLSDAIASIVDSAKTTMTNRIKELLPEEKQHLVIARRQDHFEMFYRLNCDNLCEDFKEDIEFRFSLGLAALMHRFLGNKQASRLTIFGHSEPVPRPVLLTPGTPSNEFLPPSSDWAFAAKFLTAAVSGQGITGIVAFTTIVGLKLGWKILAAIGSVYGGIYLYERLTYTNKAKERRFKKQYVAHATKKLRLIVDLTSANCSHQVQQELSGKFARLAHLVDDHMDEMREGASQQEAQIKDLDKILESSRIHRNSANYWFNLFSIFERKYLQIDES
ncbi:unnamed protein product [Darwinula stevensoni]|uniref:Dynamin-type G domain-containing protein n=1 Tax=Darwinula stevensoni TaxID=69355 RepID=A0A7R8X3X7_9CRUS|nr:unnamed protein product [Darwinula stevensoni]CAG0878986.1 unnamed protein product [Darwinula stevensoni]